MLAIITFHHVNYMQDVSLANELEPSCGQLFVANRGNDFLRRLIIPKLRSLKIEKQSVM